MPVGKGMPHLYIVAMRNGEAIDVLVSSSDGAWRTFNAAHWMKLELEEQHPHGADVTYHIVNGHRA